MSTVKTGTNFSYKLKGLITILVLIFASPVLAEKDPSQDYTLWKDTKFHRFFIDKNADFSQYSKVAFLPMDYTSLAIAPKTKKRLKRNWSNFAKTEMPNIAKRFDEEVKATLEKSTTFQPTDKAGEDVMIVSFKAIEMTPKAYMDGLATIGKETLNLVGYLRYQVVILDGHSRKVIAMIEDDHTIAPNTRATGEQPNNIGNHRRAWSLSMNSWIKRFLDEADRLPRRTMVK